MADQAFYVRRHPLGGFAVIEGTADEVPEVPGTAHVFETYRSALSAAYGKADALGRPTTAPDDDRLVIVLAEVL